MYATLSRELDVDTDTDNVIETEAEVAVVEKAEADAEAASVEDSATEVSSDESETESEVEVDIYQTDDMHNEVELMLEGSNAEIIELISTDPEYYLDIVKNYTKMRDGRTIYLPDLFNILVRRENDCLRIKFKLSDNSEWHEVGYGNFVPDKEVYKAFTEKVKWALTRPVGSHRKLLEETMKEGVKAPPPPVSQGNQYKLTKIDRFLGRQPAQVAPAPVASVSAAPAAVQSTVDKSVAEQAQAFINKVDAQNSAVPREEAVPAQVAQGRPTGIAHLHSLLSSTDPHVVELIELLESHHGGKRALIFEYLFNYQK